MNSDERICSIALTLCPGIGHIGAKRLIEGMGSAAEVFSRRKELPEIMPDVYKRQVDGCFPVDIRIDAVQSVSKDSNGREMICQSGPMGMDIYPVSQSARCV